MNRLFEKMDQTLMPLATKITSNRYLMSLCDGMVLSMPLLIVGSMLLVVTEFPVEGYQAFMGNLFGDGWKWFSDAGVSASIGLIAIFSIIGISSALAKTYGEDPVVAAVLSLAAYFTVLIQIEEGGFAVKDFGAKGLFAGMVTAFLATELYCRILKRNIIIRMPDGVPPAIAKSFAALIPSAVILIVFLGIRFLFANTSYESLNNFVLQVLQLPLTGLTCTFGGIMIATFCSHFLWFFGIHGASIVGAVTGPMFQAAGVENLEAFKANLPYSNIVTQQFNDIFQTYGGVGSTLALALLLAFYCKSKQLKTLGKLTLAPGIFGINEPLVYGLPLVLNPIMAIPFFLCPLINVSLAYFAMKLGLISLTTGVQITWSTPPIISGILGTNDFRAAILQAICILISFVIYFPFIRVLDKKYRKDELAKIGTNEHET